MAKQPDPRTLCFLCGKPGADTEDHVLPESFYVTARDNAVKAWAHRSCNQSTSLDETKVRNFLAPMASDAGHAKLMKSTLRSFGRPEAAGVVREFAERLTELPGIGGALTVDYTSLLFVVVKICRGLHFCETQRVFPPGAKWTIRAGGSELARLARTAPFRWEHLPTFAAAWATDGARSVWSLEFYGAYTLGAMSVPASEVFRAREMKAVGLSWPRRRGYEVPRPSD